MANISLSFTIPDADLPDTVAALKKQYATNGTPNPTQAQTVEALRQDVMSRVVGVVKQYRADQLSASAVAPNAT